MIGVIFMMPAVSQADSFQSYVPEAQKVGEGRLTYLFWDVYDAELYAPKGSLSLDKPFALKLSYLRPIPGKKIADRSIEEMRAQGVEDEIKLATWHEQMNRIFPDVDQGVDLTGVYTSKGETVFYQGSTVIGKIKDKEFSRAFFDIWLSEQTSAPDLRKKLLGQV